MGNQQQHNSFAKENPFDTERVEVPEIVCQIKVEGQDRMERTERTERTERMDNDKQDMNYNIEMFNNCYDNFSSAQHMESLLAVDKAVNNLSGKIETFSLSDAIETSLSMESSLVNCLESEVYNNLVGRRGSIKRCCRTAALESGSDLSPRTKQSSLHTPGNSDQLDSSNLL